MSADQPGVPVVLSGLVLVAYFTWMALVPSGGLLATVGGGATATAMSLVAGIAALRAGHRAWRGGGWADRAGWSLLGAGMLCWTVADTVWLAYVLRGVVPVPFPSVVDAGFLGLVPLCVAGLAMLTGLGHRGVRALLDGLIITGSLLVVSWILLAGPLFAAGGATWLEETVTLAYPLGDVAIASLAFIALAHGRRPDRSALALVGFGMIGLAVADSGYAIMTQLSAWNTSTLANAGWIVGFMLVAHGAARGGAATGARDGQLSAAWLALPYLPLAIAIGASVALIFTRGSAGPFVAIVFVAIVDALLIALVVARQMVALRDNAALTARLQRLVGELQSREDELRFLAFHDPLTGLANRALFQDRLARALLTRLRTPAPLAVLYVDLDGFKTVNDSLGHETGDSILVDVATRLRDCLRPEDTAARLGGDEFAILLDAVPLPAVTAVAARIVAALDQRVEGAPARIGASVGVAFHETGDSLAEDLLRCADLAMYAAKYRGKACYVLFEPHLRDEVALGRPAAS
ncbi:diguanylate cyclase domain-containing protein [Dactylosporangium sp. CS-047395]|uniref:diguanylate cyclase domain-containing protein n=1 Tax=Dactylosporangium sp. CS-047395 TaxID=3239936 RepID=UPI003D90C71F